MIIARLKNISSIHAFAIAFLVLAFAACKPKPLPNDYDKGEMLSNVADNLIVPAYGELLNQTAKLDTAILQFVSTPDSTSLAAMQNQFLAAWMSFQRCKVYEFGPAETSLYRSSLNTFPLDTAQVKSNIASGNYNLATAENADAKGFPAADYLLFQPGKSTTEIIQSLSTDSLAANRMQYLSDLVVDIDTKTQTVRDNWSAGGGNYAAEFSTNEGTDVGSSIGFLVNAINFDLELVKNQKIGLPLGVKTANIPNPHLVEAYFSKYSIELATENMKAIRDIYLGTDADGNDGEGIDEILIGLDAQYNDNLLADEIKSQMTTVIAKMEALQGNLSEDVVSNSAPVTEVYTEIQKLVVLLKVDMVSALGVSITYTDTDGD